MKRTAMMMAMAMLVSAVLTRAAQETIDVPPASAPQGGKVIPKPLMITEIEEGQRVEVIYHNVKGKMHATQVRVM